MTDEPTPTAELVAEARETSAWLKRAGELEEVSTVLDRLADALERAEQDRFLLNVAAGELKYRANQVRLLTMSTIANEMESVADKIDRHLQAKEASRE